jgi:hypothetical protein
VTIVDIRPGPTIDGPVVEAVRATLRAIRDEERPMLWNRLGGLLRAIEAGEVRLVTALIGCTPDGPIRTCLLRIATPFLSEHRVSLPARRGGSVARGRAQPEFLGMFSGLQGCVAPTCEWSCARTGLHWESVDGDAFYGVRTGRRGHWPVPLDYRHRDDVVIGATQELEVDDDGSLLGTFRIGSHPAAQHAARAAQRGDLALSMSVRFDTRWLVHQSPNDWDPASDALDICVLDHGTVEAVALTPVPAFAGATVSRVW